MREPRIFETHGGQHRFEAAGKGLEIRRFCRQTDIDSTGHHADMERAQPMRRRIEILRHGIGVHEAAVELVGPLMIGTDELGAAAGPVRADLRAAMAAGVEEATDDVVAPADDDDRRLADRKGDIVSGFGNSQSRPIISHCFANISSMSN